MNIEQISLTVLQNLIMDYDIFLLQYFPRHRDKIKIMSSTT